MTGQAGASVPGNVIRDGIATLGSAATRLLAQLDDVFLGWAERAGAVPMTAPPLLDVADQAAFRVFQNFPHLTWVAAPLRPALVSADEVGAQIPAGMLGSARLVLPTAVCYGLYPYFRDQAIAEPTMVTAAGTCFRNESRQEPGLRRLSAFRMREIVVLGTAAHVRDRLDMLTALLLRFAAELDIPATRDAAADPFYSPDAAPARWQRLQPGKHEIRSDGLAIASVNEHRKFFGEACRILGEQSGTVISTGCVGMGLERWIYTLQRRYHDEFSPMSHAVATAAAACDTAPQTGADRNAPR